MTEHLRGKLKEISLVGANQQRLKEEIKPKSELQI